MKPRLLIADDDLHVRRALERELRPHFEIETADCYLAAAALLERGSTFDAAVVDVGLGRVLGGVRLLEVLSKKNPRCVRVLISGQNADASVRQALATDLARQFIAKPWVRDELIKALQGP